MAAQAGLSLAWSETPEDTFCRVVAQTDARVFWYCIYCDASSEFVSSSIPSWQILIAHAQPFRGAWDLAFCLKVPLDSLLVWASSGGSGETARMHRLAWTFAARIGDKYQTRPFGNILFRQQTRKALTRLCGCIGWSMASIGFLMKWLTLTTVMSS